MTSHDPYGAAPRRPDFEAPEGRSSRPSRSKLGWTPTLLLLVGLAAVGKVSLSFLKRPPSASGEKTSAPASDLLTDATTLVSIKPTATESAIVSAERQALEREAAKKAARLELAKEQQRAFIEQADALGGSLDAWYDESERWSAMTSDLLTSDEGRRLAADPVRVEQFRALIDKERVSADRIFAIRTSAAKHRVEVNTWFEDSKNESPPPATAIVEIRAAQSLVGDAVTEWKQSLQVLEALRDSAKLTGGESAKTLEEVVRDLQRTERLAQAEVLRDRRARAQKEADDAILAAEEEAVRMAGQVKAREILDLAQAQVERQKAEEAKRQAEAAKQVRLDALEQDMPDVERYLIPFITKGYSQPTGSGNVQTETNGPMSYSKIQALGALKGTPTGMDMLMRCATVKNDREPGGFPAYVGGSYGLDLADKDFLRRVQELLTKHGDLLVEKGLLAP